MRQNRNLDLVAICAWAAMTVLVVGHSESEPLRLVLALPLLLFFTGHAMLRAFGPPASSRTEHAVFAVGLSIASALLGGFLLNGLGALTPLGWVLWLEAVVSASTVVGLVRQSIGGLQRISGSDVGLRARHLAMLGLASAITCGAYYLAVKDEASQQEFKYVEFWMVGGQGGAGALVVGIKSAEVRPQVFDVEVTRGSDVIAVWRSVYLDPGETWAQPLSLNIYPQRDRKISARLYGHYDGRLYRQVTAIVPSA